MSLQTVTIGDCLVSNTPDDILVTYALGSCVAVLVHDQVARIGGLLHFLLPDSRLDPQKAEENPLTFADTGIPLLFRKVYAAGATKSNLRVGIAGGSSVSVTTSFFNVGAANIAATREVLRRARITIHGESVGGTRARTVRLHVGTGKIAMQETETRRVRAA